MAVWKKVIVHGLRVVVGPTLIPTLAGKKQMEKVYRVNNKMWLSKSKGEQNLQF